jgi:N-acetylmuramoyl-L-alanine amidase
MLGRRTAGLVRHLSRGIVLAGMASVLSPAQTEEPAVVTAIRFWSLDGATRIAVESSAELSYQTGRLSDPDRIYFDLPGVKLRLSGEAAHTIRVGDKLLRQIRAAPWPPGGTRIVLDLAAPAEFTAAQLANPDRLMIELKPPEAGQALPPAPGQPKPNVPPTAVGRPHGPRLPPSEPATEVAPALPPAAGQPKPVQQDHALPRPARRDQTGKRSLVRALGLKLARVVIDPGHGGHDTGTIGRGGLKEKDLVLEVALHLGKLIEERLGAEVVFTRRDDTFVPLEDRTAFANAQAADLFLSIHANSGTRSAAGPETYYLNFTSSREALDVAARENASSEKTIHELKDVLQKIALTDKIEESREFAARVQSALAAAARKVNASAKDRGVRQAPFVVLIGASMPSILAEIGFVTNSGEERLLRRAAHRRRLAEALFDGVSDYAASLSHFQVAEKKAP